ncbi:MAG: hydrolase, partial [Syntrophobacteria bacterium]
HNAEALGVERKSTFDFALTCAESITGLVIATALVYPDKRLASVKPKSILKRMKKKDFARRVNRDQIRLCEEIGVPLADFAELSLRAMQGISEELDL